MVNCTNHNYTAEDLVNKARLLTDADVQARETALDREKSIVRMEALARKHGFQDCLDTSRLSKRHAEAKKEADKWSGMDAIFQLKEMRDEFQELRDDVETWHVRLLGSASSDL